MCCEVSQTGRKFQICLNVPQNIRSLVGLEDIFLKRQIKYLHLVPSALTFLPCLHFSFEKGHNSMLLVGPMNICMGNVPHYSDPAIPKLLSAKTYQNSKSRNYLSAGETVHPIPVIMLAFFFKLPLQILIAESCGAKHLLQRFYFVK